MQNLSDELLSYWSIFEKYDDYAEFKDYPVETLKESLSYFGKVMSTLTQQPVSKWTLKTVSQGLTKMVKAADIDFNDDTAGILILAYDVAAAYLRCLATNQLIKVDFKDLEDYLMDFETQYGLEGPVLDPLTFLQSEPFGDDPDLPQWREYVANDIQNYSNEWLDTYFKSSAWKRRSVKVTRDVLELAWTTLVERAYYEYRKTPKSWTKTAIVGVLTGYFVSNMDFTEKEYQQVAPALNQFLAFVADKGWINAKRVGNYQRFIKGAAPDMIEFSEDPRSIGLAKMIGQELTKQGVDINDAAAVQKFIDQLNEGDSIDKFYDDNQMFDNDEDEIPDDLADFLDNPKEFSRAAEIYDPDPDQTYLKDLHQPISMGWRQSKAVKVHALAAETGIRLWLKREDYAIPNTYLSSTLLFIVVDFMDILYAENLVTPEQWTVAMLKELGVQYQKVQSAKEYSEMKIIVAGLISVLRTADVLTKKQAGQLPAAFNGQPIPVIDEPKKVTGKVVSMKEARKLLKNKKRRH